MDKLMSIDIKYSFLEDYLNDIDPDGQNKTLRHWHKLLWAKQLPYNKGFFTLEEKRKNYNYLYHKSKLGEYYLTSDTIINEYYDYGSSGRHKDMQPIISYFSKENIYNMLHKITTIGGYIVFPIGNGYTLNQARGCNGRILDRFDLTLECIRLYYIKETNLEINPLAKTICNYEEYFQLFTDFKGYCEYFLLQDLVLDNYKKIKYFLPFDGFKKNPKPKSAEEYNIFMNNCIDFITKRNNRIMQYIQNKE